MLKTLTLKIKFYNKFKIHLSGLGFNPRPSLAGTLPMCHRNRPYIFMKIYIYVYNSGLGCHLNQQKFLY